MKILSQVSQYSDLTTGYVYQWTNLINGKKYIGSHCGTNPRYKTSGTAIKAAFKKYGFENFHRDILYIGVRYQEVELEILGSINAKESLNFYNLTNLSVKIDTRAEKNGMYGKKHSEETKAKIAAASRGVIYSTETRAKIGAAGKARSEESRAKTRATLKVTLAKKKAALGA